MYNADLFTGFPIAPLSARARRRFSRKRRTAAGALGLAMSVTGLVSTGVLDAPVASAAGSVPTRHVLNLPFLGALAQPPDPDVYYADEGINITDNVYDNLVRYKANVATPVIQPDLATSWTISPDGLTYTFNLRPNVKFHDGTPFTSAVIAPDFARRTAVNAGPAYMVSDVASITTPSPLVAVITLKTPNNAFLDYLASAYGPRMMSPVELAANAGADHDQTWMQTHDAGSGPYVMSKAVPGQSYTLTYFPGYWGPKPYYTTINFTVTPSITTQELELEKGQLDLIEHSLPTSSLPSFQSNKNFKVYEFPTLEEFMLYINPKNGALGSTAVRGAIVKAINKKLMVSTVWPGQATVANQIYPTGEVPSGTALSNAAYNPSALTALKAKLGNQTLTVDYQTGEPVVQQVANLVQADLAAVGVKVQAVGIPQSQIYNFAGTGPKNPSIIVIQNWPDAANPYTWAHIIFDVAGGLSFFSCPAPSASAVLTQGVAATTKATEQSLFERAGALYSATNCWDPISNNHDTMVAPSWLAGLAHNLAAPYSLDLAMLHPVGL